MSHDAATCPAFGGCNDCRSAKFEATSPDVAIPTWTRPADPEPDYDDTIKTPTAATHQSVSFGPPWAEAVDYSSAEWSADPVASPDEIGKIPREYIPPVVDPVDYAGVPAFNAAADATLARAGAVHTQRGNTYGDSWALKNIVTTFLDCALTAIYGDSDIPIDAKRLLESASIADVKESRLKNGSWKLDNSDDGINYRAAYATWHTEYTEAHGI